MGTFLETCRFEKLPKINIVFPIIHYNRDLNTNWAFAATRHSGSIRSENVLVTENDLLQKLFGFRSSASDMFVSSTSSNFPVVCKRFECSGPAVASLATRNVLIWICPESL